ncbi:MAG: methyltransferase domain [Harvfovirus sp.]|uniref:Small RNA 2'-O-methyltransferase n=1 Tax=Harvfovirus sp. TaxID=2487768 RepID=A0A3G5A179_9VIRU|nr:MAG: methyltransferase domain [Harvfovirus sp.]
MIVLLSSLLALVEGVDLSKCVTHVPGKIDEKLFSENKELGFIIKKNPASGMIKRIIKEGEVSGYYYKGTVGYYVLHFRDVRGVSFANHSYVNPSQYSSAQAVIHMVSEVLENKKVIVDQDMICVNTFHVMLVRIDNMRTIESFVKGERFVNVFVEIVPCDNLHHYYSVTVKTRMSIYYLLNFVQTLFITIASLNSGDFHVADALAIKLVRCLNYVDAPYFIRYLMASRILYRKDFKALKVDLENCRGHIVSLNYGTTANHRLNYIKKLLGFDKSIVDIGCGDGFYAVGFSKLLGDIPYFAFDTDQAPVEQLKKKKVKHSLMNLHIFAAKEELYDRLSKLEGKIDVIITEVVEHMGKAESREFLLELLEKVKSKFNIIIITTPNYEFNVNYCSDGKFRHFDHKWEMNVREFRGFMGEILNTVKLGDRAVEYVGIGDVVDSIACTQGVIIKNN